MSCWPAAGQFVDPHANVTELVTVRNVHQGDLFPPAIKQDLEYLRRQQRFQRLESQWLPLPSFTFAAPITTVKDKEGLGKFVKGMMEIFALGVSEIMPRSLQRIEFVSLCSIKRLPSDYSLMFQTPFQELVGFMMDHVRPRMLPIQVKAQLEKFHSEFRLVSTCEVYEDGIVPFVTICNPPLRQIVFTYNNQINSPKQFLDPFLSNTTSGFLNFIGTMLLLDRQDDPPVVFYEKLDAILDSCMNVIAHHQAALGADEDYVRRWPRFDQVDRATGQFVDCASLVSLGGRFPKPLDSGSRSA